MTVQGCDISHFQSAIPSGLDFYFHKCTEGTDTIDAMYTGRQAIVHDAGKVWGAYHFFHMTGDTSSQVHNFVVHSNIQPGDIVALDFEDVPSDPWSKFTKQQVANKCAEMLSMLRATYPTNRLVMYCNESTLTEYVEAFHVPSYDGLWIADYSKRPNSPFVFWQYADAPYDRDLSDAFADLGALKEWCRIGSPAYVAPASSHREDRTVLVPAGNDEHVTIVSQGASKLVIGSGYTDQVTIHQIDSWGSNASGWNSIPVGVGGHVGEFGLNPNEPLDIDLPQGSVVTIVRYTANHSFAIGVS